jgi:protein subunit release factor B
MPSPAGESERALAARLRRLGIHEEDLEETFVRSAGSGGQNVNKVATCVVLRHLPTGLLVKCQEERTQARNRQRARLLLAEKLEARAAARAREEAARVAKLRRQRRRRSPASKERMLEEKRARAVVKRGRGRVRAED